MSAPLPLRQLVQPGCSLRGGVGVNIFRALCPGHLQLASGYAVGLRGGTLKCLRFRHICRQDVRTGAWGRGGRMEGEGGSEEEVESFCRCC